MAKGSEVKAKPVNAQETSEQAIKTQIKYAPQILESEQATRPGFAQLDVDILSQALPELADVYRGIQEQDLAFQREQFPETARASEGLEQFLGGIDIGARDAETRGGVSSAIDEYLNGEDVFRPGLEKNLREDIRSGQLARGQEQFGFAALEEASGLAGLREQLRLDRLNARLQKVNVENQLNSQALNTALSTSGRVPVSSGQPVQFQAPGQQVQNVSPSQFFNTAFNNQQAQLSADQYNASRVSPFAQFAGGLFGTATNAYIGSRF